MTIRGLEPLSANAGNLDVGSITIEYVLASLAAMEARLEARLEAHARGAAEIRPPPLPDPDPPYNLVAPDQLDGQQHSYNQPPHLPYNKSYGQSWYHPPLGFGSGISSRGPQSTGLPGGSAWDRYGVSAGMTHGRQTTAWDNPAHRMDNRAGRHVPASENAWDRREEVPYSDWQRPVMAGATSVAAQPQLGFGGQQPRGPHRPALSESSPWERHGYNSTANRQRGATAWDNPAFRHEVHAGGNLPAWDGPWGRHDGAGYSEPTRYDHRSEKPRYDEDADFHHDPSSNSQLIVIVVPPPPPQCSPSCLNMTSHCHSAATLPVVVDVPSSNLPPTVPSCSPDDDRGEESGLLDVLPPPAVISPPCSPCISGEEEALLDDDEEVDSIEEVKKVVTSLEAARITSHDVVENCLSGNCGAYLCALVGYKVAPSFPIHLKEIAFICRDLHVRDPTRPNPRSTYLDTDARLIPPRNDTSRLSIIGSVDKLFVLGWNFADHIGYPLLIDDGGDEVRRSAVRCAFDPGGNIYQSFDRDWKRSEAIIGTSMIIQIRCHTIVGYWRTKQRSYVFDPGGDGSVIVARRCFLVPTLRTRWILTVGELIREYLYEYLHISFISCIIRVFYFPYLVESLFMLIYLFS